MSSEHAVRTSPLSTSRTAVRIFWIIAFAALSAVGAQIEIPLQPVPLTMQTLFVLLAGGLLGPVNGSLSILVYLGLGAAGVPVFSGFSFGFTRLVGPTGGYLLAFPVAAFVAGWTAQRSPKFFGILAGMAAALLLIFTSGVLFLQTFYLHDWSLSLKAGVMVFSWWDLAKLVAATGITFQFQKQFKASR